MAPLSRCFGDSEKENIHFFINTDSENLFPFHKIDGAGAECRISARKKDEYKSIHRCSHGAKALQEWTSQEIYQNLNCNK